MVAPAAPTPGRITRCGRADFLRPVGDLASMAQMLQGARDAGQVAGPVIDDRYHLAFTRDHQTYHADATECRGAASGAASFHHHMVGGLAVRCANRKDGIGGRGLPSREYEYSMRQDLVG